MSDKILVIILKCDTKPGDYHIKKLKNHFNHHIIHIMDVNDNDDTEKFKLALRWAKQEYDNHHCLIIKDSSIIHVDVQDYIKEFLQLDFNLFFLCKYQDDCHQYLNIDHHPHLKQTMTTCSTQAILFDVKARNLILKELSKSSIKDCLFKNLQNHILTSVVCTPNIVHFDANLAKSNDDFYKLNECAIIHHKINKIDSTNMVWLFLIILLIIFLVIIAPYFKYYRKL